MSQVVLGQMGLLGPGTDATLIDHVEDNLDIRGCPMGHLGLGTYNALRPHLGQPWMSQVVLGQMGHLGPRTDGAHIPR